MASEIDYDKPEADQEPFDWGALWGTNPQPEGDFSNATSWNGEEDECLPPEL